MVTPGEYWHTVDERERHRVEIAGALIARSCLPSRPGPPRLVAGHRSAGFLHSLPLPQDTNDERQAVAARAEGLLPWNRRPWHIELISADRGRRAYGCGVDTRPAAIPQSHVVLDRVIPISNLARTAVDLMRDGTRAEAVAVADAAMHTGVERAELEAVTRHCRQWPNAVQAREAVAFADPRAESPAESLARLTCADDGIFPDLQISLYDAFGEIGRVDLLLRALRIVVEVDGAIKRLDPYCGDARRAMEEQEARERRLRDAGWTVIRTTWHELTYAPEQFIARLRAAMAAAAILV